MPRFGERIGDAYVRIHADGSNFGDDLQKDLNSAQLGEDEGSEFEKGFEKGFNKKFNEGKFAKSFDKAIGRMSGRLKRLDDLEEDIRTALEGGFIKTFGGDLGQRMADNLVNDLREGLRDIGPGIFGDLEAQVRRASEQIIRENDAWQKELVAGEKRWAEESEAIRKKQFDLLKADIIERNKFEIEEEKKRTDLLNKYLLKQSQDYDKAFELRIKQLEREAAAGKRVAETFTDSDHRLKRMLGTLKGSLTDLDKFEKGWDRIADGIGRATGRGSRNNFLNFIGSVNRNLTRTFGSLLTLGPRLVGVFKTAFGEFKVLRDQGASFGSALTQSIGGLVATVASGIPGLLAMAAGFGLLIATAGVLVTVLSGLLAIMTALVATISFALVGAFAALLGAMLPLAAGIGVVVAGFASLDDAQKKALKNDLQPLITSFKDLGDAAASHLFRDVGQWAKDLKPLIEGFRPAIIGVADAIRTSIGGAIDRASTSPGFERFQRKFNKFLPDAVSMLSNSIINLGSAMGGVFTAMIPITRDFLTWLERITGEFSEWANSKQGQKELKQFFEDAGEAAKDVGEFIKQAAKFLGELLSQGKDEGSTIFKDMAEGMKELVEWAKSPEGKKSIDDWLDFGTQLADKLGDVVEKAQKLWDELDTPENRTFVLWLVEQFGNIIVIIADLVGWWNRFSQDVAITLVTLQTTIGNIKDGVTDLFSINPVDWLSNPLGSAQQMADAVSQIFTNLTRLPVVGDLFGPASTGASMYRDGITRIRNAIQGLPAASSILFDRARNGAQDLLAKVGQLINKIPGIPQMKNIFKNPLETARDFLDVLRDIAGRLASAFHVNIDWPSPPAWLKKITPGLASGGIVSGAQTRLIGEAGPEAVVPLNRPLNMVDPSVRWLSAIAQGMAVPDGSAGGGGRNITIPSINVVTPVEDPAAVAREVINIVVGSGY
jgi:hypothetical protein